MTGGEKGSQWKAIREGWLRRGEIFILDILNWICSYGVEVEKSRKSQTEKKLLLMDVSYMQK